MEKDLEKIVGEVRKMIRGELGQEEKAWLEECLGKEKLLEILSSGKDDRFIRGKLEEYFRYSYSQAYVDFKKKVRFSRVKKWIYRGGAVAAVVVLMVGTFFIHEQKKEVQSLATTPDEVTLIEPGTRKAVLKLADGSVVDVVGDSMKIQDKSGAEIEYADGKIAYQSHQEVTKLVYNELVVPVAGECFIVLDDRTKVWINSDSRLKYPVKFIGDERKVFLEGEAYFEVEKDGKPFIVITPRGDIRVLGTSFDVKVYPEEENMLTTLVDGKVNFKNAAGKAWELLPGEQVVVNKTGSVEKREVNLEEYLGWREGIYVFRDQRLETIMTDLGRWYDVSVFYQNPEMKEIRFTGNLQRYDNINTFMEVLNRTGEVKYNIEGKTIILYR